MKFFNAIVLSVALMMVTAPANAGTNLIINGSFETPDVPPGINSGPVGGWEVFYEPILGWATITTCGMEIQDHVIGSNNEAWLSYDGDQLAEMDGYPCNDIGGMEQTVTTVLGQRYKLCFAYSPRPALASTSSGTESYINNVYIDTISTDGVGLWNTVWSIANYTFTATGTSSTIKFMTTQLNDGMSTLIDDVKLFPVTVLSCEGFEYPMDQPFTLVGSTKRRVFPLKMSLIDASGSPITNNEITSPPEFEVEFADTYPNPLPFSTSAPLGSADADTQFIFRNGQWELYIPAGGIFSVPGTYTIRVISGDTCEYTINPTCEATFVIPKKEGKKGGGPK